MKGLVPFCQAWPHQQLQVALASSVCLTRLCQLRAPRVTVDAIARDAGVSALTAPVAEVGWSQVAALAVAAICQAWPRQQLLASSVRLTQLRQLPAPRMNLDAIGRELASPP